MENYFFGLLKLGGGGCFRRLAWLKIQYRSSKRWEMDAKKLPDWAATVQYMVNISAEEIDLAQKSFLKEYAHARHAVIRFF